MGLPDLGLYLEPFGTDPYSGFGPFLSLFREVDFTYNNVENYKAELYNFDTTSKSWKFSFFFNFLLNVSCFSDITDKRFDPFFNKTNL